VTIPPNTTAQLPLTTIQQAAYFLDGVEIAKSKRAHATGEQQGEMTYVLPAGSYSFTIANVQ